MARIYKYTLPKTVDEPVTVRLPAGAQVVSAEVQGTDVMVWAAVDPEADAVDHVFLVATTGSELPGGLWRHIDTVFMGPFVLHVQKAVES